MHVAIAMGENKATLVRNILSKKSGASQAHYTFTVCVQPQANLFILSKPLHVLNSGNCKYGTRRSRDRPGCAVDECGDDDANVFAVAEGRGGISVSC